MADDPTKAVPEDDPEAGQGFDTSPDDGDDDDEPSDPLPADIPEDVKSGNTPIEDD